MSPRRTSTQKRRPAGESGQAIVEFVLILPLFVLLLFMIVTFSKAFGFWNDTQQLANVAARYAAVGNSPSGSSLAAAVKEMADTDELELGTADDSGVRSPGVEICIQMRDTDGVAGIGVGDAVTAEVSATYRWLNLPYVGRYADKTLRGRATMRIERLPQGGVSVTTSCTTTGT